MTRLTGLAIAFLLAHSVCVQAIFDYVGCGIIQRALAGLAVREAMEVAKYGSDVLTKDKGILDDVNKAAYLPLFNRPDVSRVIEVFNNVAALESSVTMKVTFYCTEDHVVFDQAKNGWVTTGFKEKNSGNEIRLDIPQSASDAAKIPRPKPGARGSYTILGWNSVNEGDFSNQATVFLSPARFGQGNVHYDQRLYVAIKAGGLADGYNFLSYIKPLTQTVFHELTHVAGGLKDPVHASKRIKDGQNTYGWIKCTEAKRANLPGLSPIDIADSYTMLAQALFLQIKGQKTYWSTGAVDPKTYVPLVDIPKQPGTKLKRDLRDEQYVGNLMKRSEGYLKRGWVA